MHMLLMAGLMLLFFFVSITFICLYRDKLDAHIWNLAFVLADVVFFFCWNYASNQYGWLSDGFMTLDNISPLMFTLIPLTYFMKDSVKDYCFSAIAFLSFGMFCAMMISPEHAYLFNFNEEASFLYTSEAACHMLCAVFGIYLVMSNQVKPNFRQWIKSIVFMYSIISFGVVLNFVFHKRFFGMDPYGEYSIYFLDIFGSFATTLIAYYLGVMVVLTIGMQMCYLMDKISKKHAKAELLPKLEEEI